MLIQSIRKAIDTESVNWKSQSRAIIHRVRIISVTLFGGTCNRLTIATWKVFTIIASVRLESGACCSQHNSRCSSAPLNKHHYHQSSLFVYVRAPSTLLQLSIDPHFDARFVHETRTANRLENPFTVSKHFRFRPAHARERQLALSSCNCQLVYRAEGQLYLFKWLLHWTVWFMRENRLESLRALK